MYQARQKVMWFAIASRTFIILAQVIFNAICPDHNADAFRTPSDPTEKLSSLDSKVEFILGGLTRWDAQYFIHIAKYGYTYENTLAFFPLFPVVMRYTSMIFQVEPPIFNHTNTIVISGIVINFACFVKAALKLYDLSELVFKDTKVAYRAAILFCINPASIFFTALYTESMFAYLTFYAMFESLNNNSCAFLPVSLSCIVRSNGLVNIGFPSFYWLRSLLVTSIPNFSSENSFYHANIKTLLFNCRHILISLLRIIFIFILSLLPFGYLQVYYYTIYCKHDVSEITLPYHVKQYAKDNDLLLPVENDFSWCKSKMPIAYSHIQNKYWNVGFLKYYEFKQIPNFLLAFPILFIMIKYTIKFLKEHKSKFRTKEFFTGILQNEKKENEKYPVDMFVFVVHGLFLTLFCIFFVHIQVSTRLLCSASPLLYWYCSLITLQEAKSSKEVKSIEYETPENLFSKWKVFFLTQQRYSKTEKFVYGYFLSYMMIGCFMFSNFLPWT